MLVKAKAIPPVPVTPTLDEVELTLNAEDAYWLAGVLGAQTDSVARKLYNGLSRAISEETGERANLIVQENDIAHEAYKRANSNRKNGGVAEQKHLEFIYHGLVRTVIDATIDSRRGLLKGFEMTKGQAPSEQFKSYRLDLIGY